LIKIKEPSYSQALDKVFIVDYFYYILLHFVPVKGGGLIRVYTALVPPFRHRTVIACFPKTSVKEAIQMVLVQLGRDYVDPKEYVLLLNVIFY